MLLLHAPTPPRRTPRRPPLPSPPLPLSAAHIKKGEALFTEKKKRLELHEKFPNRLDPALEEPGPNMYRCAAREPAGVCERVRACASVCERVRACAREPASVSACVVRVCSS